MYINEPKGVGGFRRHGTARQCGSPYVEQGGGDVAFGEDEEDAS